VVIYYLIYPIDKAEKGGRVGAVEYTKNGFNSLVLHEIGHWFGLDDGYDTGDNQYPNENTNTIMDCHGCTTNKYKVTTKQRATISLSSDLGIGPATSTGNVYKKSNQTHGIKHRYRIKLLILIEKI